jgi:hypothetical protein
MGAEPVALVQGKADAIEFFIPDGMTSISAQQVQDTGNGHNGQSLPRCEPDEDVPGEERAVHLHGPISPLGSLSVQREVVFNGASVEVLRDALLVVGDHMQNVPGVLKHAFTAPKSENLQQIARTSVTHQSASKENVAKPHKGLGEVPGFRRAHNHQFAVTNILAGIPSAK